MTTTTNIVIPNPDPKGPPFSLLPVTNQLGFSNTVLAGSAAFTSGVFSGDNVGSVGVRVESDQSGSLALETTDGATSGSDTWDTIATHAVTGGTPLEVTDTPAGGLMRYVYTNGGTGQANFRFSAYSLGVRNDV